MTSLSVGDQVKCVYPYRLFELSERATQDLAEENEFYNNLGKRTYVVTYVTVGGSKDDLIQLEGIVHPKGQRFHWFAAFFEKVDTGFFLDAISK